STNLIRMLNIQYRMAEPICRFPSRHIYNGQLLTDELVQEERARFHLKPYDFINVAERRDKLDPISQSYFNQEEAQCIADLIHYLTQRGLIELSSISIITPYRAQLALISKQVGSCLDIGTVDGFQGREKDIILISTVRTCGDKCGQQSIGFVADRRRLNVAVTRGKYAVYIIGHAKSLNVNKDWRSLIRNARRRRCILNYKKYEDFDWLYRL
ncbi:unnamed protein product, partial [Adineta ricciae]